ncbi:DNA polymerase III subunit beta [Rickettsiella grylli]|uniref:DNA polymerase III subunit beta n=1 Tax=Rickettsiella grylli TaxID=59196 RepID=UPI0008FD1353|nr:DNA polymerase III subunit beta [Rickettsiella grylli]OIZ99660.1 DNA polymerase III subunit beta [Rickettsiella grylli]
MQFTINREILLKPLQLVTAVIERRQTLPILSNLLIRLNERNLSLLGTDMEVELAGRITLEKPGQSGTTTAPARKLMDICRSLPEESELKFQQKGDKLYLQCGRCRFNLSTLPATDFPISEALDNHPEQAKFVLSPKGLRSLIESTNFAMAHQDVRYFLNGMLWELDRGSLRAVATDGHRLALNVKEANITVDNNQIIVPRKAIYELSRLLSDEENDSLTIFLTKNQLKVAMQDYTFTSKLIDGTFPDYDRVIPKSGDKIFEIDRDLFKASLLRVSVLSNDKHKSVCLELRRNLLRIFANNLEQEDAEDYLDIAYHGKDISIAFNINYLIDVLNSLPAGPVKITLTSAEASVRLESKEKDAGLYVIMPMRI